MVASVIINVYIRWRPELVTAIKSSGIIKVFFLFLHVRVTPIPLVYLGSMESAQQALSFHVYRVGGFLGDDKIVKAQDKVTVK